MTARRVYHLKATQGKRRQNSHIFLRRLALQQREGVASALGFHGWQLDMQSLDGTEFFFVRSDSLPMMGMWLDDIGDRDIYPSQETLTYPLPIPKEDREKDTVSGQSDKDSTVKGKRAKPVDETDPLTNPNGAYN